MLGRLTTKLKKKTGIKSQKNIITTAKTKGKIVTYRQDQALLLKRGVSR